MLQRNSTDVLGPSVFSEERGTSRLRNAEVRVLRQYDGGKEGGMIVRKSSRTRM